MQLRETAEPEPTRERPVRSPRPLIARWLGRVPYAVALGMQETLVAELRAGRAADTLLLLEHPPVITLGRSADPSHVLLNAAQRRARRIELHDVGRGGDVTYHGRGQLVGYPIVALPAHKRDLHVYLRDLEQGLLGAVAEYGIAAERAPGLTGIWAGNRKLAAIGVRVSTGWITSHGFALNVTIDLTEFGTIVPCGIADRGVTSMAEILGRPIALPSVAATVARHVATALGMEPVAAIDEADPLALDAPTPVLAGDRSPWNADAMRRRRGESPSPPHCAKEANS